MILRSVRVPDLTNLGDPQPAFDLFLKTQKDVSTPCRPILQSSHSHLAGELAARLIPEPFGPLPDEVIQAARQHDYGWIGSDLTQLSSKPAQPLRPFPDLDPTEKISNWKDCIRLAESASPLVGVLVSRHFCMIAADAEYSTDARFFEEETTRRKHIERRLTQSPDELDRWAAALGFCDLVSLYLCSGTREPAEFPFCHPADRVARGQARKAILTWNGDCLHFEPSVIVTGTQVSQYLMTINSGGRFYDTDTLHWEFN
jgi:Protein of unknown function (DUF3891)